MALANFQRSFQEARARHTDRRAFAGIEKTIAGTVIFASKEGTCQLDMSLHGDCTSHQSEFANICRLRLQRLTEARWTIPKAQAGDGSVVKPHRRNHCYPGAGRCEVRAD